MESKLNNFNKLKILFSLCTVSYFFIGVLPMNGYADVMTNDNYNIDTENITIDNILHSTMPNAVIKPTNPTQTIPQKSYQIESDFANSQLSFSISQDTINFGGISSADPVIRKNELSISNSIGSYQIIAYENQQLTATTSAIIPDTSCDNGSCSENTPAEWTSALTYGFGYHCDNMQGTPCSKDFIQTDYFAPFSNLKRQQVGASLMHNISPVQNDQAEITYKVVISGTQQASNYTNTVSYLAIPGF